MLLEDVSLDARHAGSCQLPNPKLIMVTHVLFAVLFFSLNDWFSRHTFIYLMGFRYFAGTPYTQQSYKVSESFPFKWINKKWKEGFHVTSMTTAGSRWGVVMSRNAGYSDQVWLSYYHRSFKFWSGDHLELSISYLMILKVHKTCYFKQGP